MMIDPNNIIIILTILGGIICIVKSAWGLLRYTVENIVTPLSNNIKQLQETTKELKDLVDTLRNKQQEFEHRLTVVEQTIAALHSRIEEVGKTCKDNLGIMLDHTKKI